MKKSVISFSVLFAVNLANAGQPLSIEELAAQVQYDQTHPVPVVSEAEKAKHNAEMLKDIAGTDLKLV